MRKGAAQPQTEQKTCFFAQGRADLRALTTRPSGRSSTTKGSNRRTLRNSGGPKKQNKKKPNLKKLGFEGSPKNGDFINKKRRQCCLFFAFGSAQIRNGLQLASLVRDNANFWSEKYAAPLFAS